MFLWLATSKRIFLLCLNTIKQYIFALVKSIPIPFEILPTHIHTCSSTFLTTNAKMKSYCCIWERKMKSKSWRSWQQRQQQLKPFYDSERNGNGLVEERILSSNISNSVTCKTSFIAFANQFYPHTALHHYMMHDWTEEELNFIVMIYLWGPVKIIINWRL